MLYRLLLLLLLLAMEMQLQARRRTSKRVTVNDIGNK
jgi:hypothetical protein